MGEGAFARLSIQSSALSGTAAIPTAIEQFDLQDPGDTMWAYDTGWHEAEYSPAFGVWRWASDRSILRIEGPPRSLRITMSIESPLRYFPEASQVRALAGDRLLASTTIATSTDWTFDVPADALAASSGRVTIETDHTFVPGEQSGADLRRLGLRVFSISIANSLTPAESTR